MIRTAEKIKNSILVYERRVFRVTVTEFVENQKQEKSRRNSTNKKKNAADEDSERRSVKKTLTLCGPFIQITVEDGGEKPFYIFLLKCEHSLHVSKNHSSIHFKVPNGDDVPWLVKAKSKKHNVVKQWYNMILKNISSYENYTISHYETLCYTHRKTMLCKLTIAKDSVRIVDSETRKKIFEANRLEKFNVHKSEQEPKLIITTEHASIDLTFTKELELESDEAKKEKDSHRPKSVSMLVTWACLTSKCPEIDKNKKFQMVGCVVPEISTEMKTNINNVVDSMQQSGSMLLRTITEKAGLESKPATKSVKNANVPTYSFEDIIVRRFHSLYDNIKESEENNVRSVIERITNASFSNPVEYRFDKTKIIKFPDSGGESYAIDDDAPPNVKDVDYCLEEPINYNEFLDKNDDDNINLLMELKKKHEFDCPDVFINPEERIISTVAASDWQSRPAFALGIFMQGLRLNLDQVWTSLSNIKFSVDDICKLIQEYKFESNTELAIFFQQLFANDLAYSFFDVLEYSHAFKQECYYEDAIVRSEGFCRMVASLFDTAIVSTDFSKIPFVNEVFTYICVRNVTRKLRAFRYVSNIICGKVEEDFNGDLLFCISYTLLLYCGKTQIGDLFSCIEKYAKNFNSIKNIPDNKPEEKSLNLLINLIVNDELKLVLEQVLKNPPKILPETITIEDFEAYSVLMYKELDKICNYFIVGDTTKYAVDICPYIKSRFNKLEITIDKIK